MVRSESRFFRSTYAVRDHKPTGRPSYQVGVINGLDRLLCYAIAAASLAVAQ